MRNLFRTFSLKNIDFILIALVVTLNVIGIIAVGDAAPHLQKRQIAGSILSLAVMFLVSAADYKHVLKFYWVFYGLNLALLTLVLAVGSSSKGAQRWVSIAGIRFQPSEAAKILLILFFAKFIMKYKNRIQTFGMVAVCAVLAVVPVLLVYSQPDLSTSIMIMVIFAVMMFVGGLSYKLVGTVLIIAVPSVIIFINLVAQEGTTLLNEYQRDRILAWLHPEDFATTTAYQTMNSIMAIGSGQLSGKSGNASSFTSLLKSGYISESQTDFIFTVVGEEFGFIGSCVVVILLMLIALRCLSIARTCSDMSGSIIAAGTGAWVGFQGFLNIGVATGVLPNTGIPLPFVSYGLTSLICLYIAIGFVLNVRMQNRRKGSTVNSTEFGRVYEYSAYRS